MLRYPVRLTEDDNDTILVEFPDIPEAVTFGETQEEALLHAEDALATAIEAYIKDKREIPAPSKVSGLAVTLPALVAAKVNLYRTMREGHIGKAELSRRLNWHLPQVDRLLDVHHGSQLQQLEAAFRALGKQMTITIADEPAYKATRTTEQPRRTSRVPAHGRARARRVTLRGRRARIESARPKAARRSRTRKR